ncbi:Uncaracterized surface protein containing fasciclin (FAS1) repeats [Noviherbaspirillum humi]|uniref:Uncaracterized surface protein containing fasciclin (FAS1) repeats n=1 Tax=Noviherbaspirillum humi TaxID=1688639 RepID=A0A239GQ15_9BURK|nr:fasciclin domain-containing protein [Noviherbaspirillum humi]SNS71061.1 Uncaracterized surface protein containing fasciclin (FAS1) repeats [Noviherbaspirillum humi]
MRFIQTLCILALSLLLAACGGDDDASPATSSVAASTTIDKVAQSNGFNALLAAAVKAELSTTLADPSQRLTVFAPTDAAFTQLASRLGFDSATAMVQALPATTLKNILSYHVLQGGKQAADLSAPASSSQPTLYSFGGQPATLAVAASGSSLRLTDAVQTSATVTTPNVAASNGVIHVIDKVLVPPGVLNAVQMARANPELSSLVAALTAANLQNTLSGAGPFTVFAPTNAAFAQAPAGLSTQQLTTVLTYHVLGSQVLAAQIPFGTPVQTLSGQSIAIASGTPPTIVDTTATPARITATDIRASNGVIHLIDKVLIPAL